MIFNLISDFGVDSFDVGVIKGTLLKFDSNATFVDTSHAIQKYSVEEAAFVLSEIIDSFPSQTCHFVCVDPKPNCSSIVVTRVKDQYVCCPNNGILSYLEKTQDLEAFEELRVATPSTFRARDTMVPAVIRFLQSSEDFKRVKPALFQVPEVVRSDHEITGHILHFDCFGNAITNLEQGLLSDRSFHVHCADHRLDFVASYDAASSRQAIALIGSTGKLEISVVEGNAKKELELHRFQEISLSLLANTYSK